LPGIYGYDLSFFLLPAQTGPDTTGVLVKCFASKQAGFFLVAFSMRLFAAQAVDPAETPDTQPQGSSSVWQKNAAPDKSQPRPVKPPKEPSTRGSELSLVVGVSFLPSDSYSYDTRISIPGADVLQYSGRQRSLALRIFGGGSFTLPGPLRRITVGTGINGGGADSRYQVISNSVTTPFSKEGLYSDIQLKYSFRRALGPAFTPFIEHDIGFFHGSRVRVGYQYWDQTGSYTGSFLSTDGKSMIDYNVQLNLRSHLFRLSVNDYVTSQDDTGTTRSKRRSGMIQQWGITVGTHQTIAIFAAIGPSWQFAR
jgi:hypothetical protein